MKYLVFALSLLFVASMPAWADLNDEMEGMLDDMSNFTAPGVYETQRRGVISGGSYSGRNKIMNENLLSVVPPSVGAGCGGIDLFGGSFSYISADRLVNLFRSVASNAKGYAFQIALKEMCETCMATIESLQKKLQALNQMSLNSCEAAQGIVTDSVMAMKGTLTKENSMIAQTAGNYGDTFQSMFDTDPSKTAQQTAPQETSERITGNLVWRALNKGAVQSWFTYGDTSMLEAIMSMTGTVIVQNSVESDDEGESNPTMTAPSTIDLQDLIEGGEVTVLDCVGSDNSANGCLEVQTRTVQLKGLAQRIEEMLLGTSTTPGIVHKMTHLDSSPLNQEKAFIIALPGSYGTFLRKLATANEAAAVMFVEETSRYIALDMARELLLSATKAAQAAAASEEHAYAQQANELIYQARVAIQRDALMFEDKYAKTDLLTKYQAYLSEQSVRPYVASGSQKNVSIN
ncbi:conjugative transfer pilus assembly protein TraH [Salinisphaera shabanensis T35B1]|uniref:conjugal transfer protein TraH n=1 Tax=Salinisphaera TaxID=180541 RepID=UPI0033421569